MDDNELTSQEKQYLEEWNRVQLPSHLLDKTIDRLRTKSLLRNTARRVSFSWVYGIAAAFILFALGILAGRATTAKEEYSYIFLLREDRGFRNGPDQFEEYSRWAASIRERGLRFAGEKIQQFNELAGDSTIVTNAEARVSGYFLLEANSPDEAMVIARECPHLKYGGIIEVNRIVQQ